MTIPAPGQYLARAVSYALGTASTGTEQVGVELEIVDPDLHPTGEKVTWYGFFSEKAAEQSVKSLRQLGWTGEDITKMEEEGLGSVDVPISVYLQDYNGKQTVKVMIGAGGGVAMKERMDDVGKSSLSERLRGYVLASKPAAPAPAPTAGRKPRF